MMHISNFFECDRLSAVAGEAMSTGMIVKVSDTGKGERKLMKLLDADTPAAGAYAIVTKELVDPNEVDATTAGADTGIRTVSIASGDPVLELRKGVKVRMSLDLLHSSLDPNRAGTLPAVGDTVLVKGSQFCKNNVAGAVATVIAKVLRVYGSGNSAELGIELPDFIIEVALPVSKLSTVEFPAQYLSQFKPESIAFTQHGRSNSAVLPLVDRRYRPRVDRSLEGGPIPATS